MMTEAQLKDIEALSSRLPTAHVVNALIAEVRRLQQLMADNPQVITNDTLKAQRDSAPAERDEARTNVYSLRQMVETWHVRAEAHRQANEATTLALTEARRVLREVLKAHSNMGVSGDWLHTEIAAVLAQEETR